jgi:LPPG:FO 2-phospho-L-lactate transferase
MSNEPVRTRVRTDEGWLDFQEYFVGRHQAPAVRAIRFEGIEAAVPTAPVQAAFQSAKAVIVGPSNPLVSIDPIVAVRGIADLIADARARGVPVVAVSGIVGGKALKGPADRMLQSLGFEASARAVAERYANWLDGFVLDSVDAALEPSIRELGPRTCVTDTIMADDARRTRLARVVLEFAASLR